MPKGYTTKTAIENYMLTVIDASFDDQIDEWIEAAEWYEKAAATDWWEATKAAHLRKAEMCFREARSGGNGECELEEEQA